MDKFNKAIRKWKRPVNYIVIMAFLLAITLFPTHMMLVAGTMASLPMPIQMLILSVIGGSHLIRSYRKDIMNQE